jgi:hypothetical protein
MVNILRMSPSFRSHNLHSPGLYLFSRAAEIRGTRKRAKRSTQADDNRVIILFAFLIGINEGLCLGSVIDAGVSTIFVGLGEDPMYVPLSLASSLCPFPFPHVTRHTLFRHRGDILG